jgi:anti-sigma factor RsiW
MPDLGTLTAPAQSALHAYLTTDPDTPAEAAAWRAYLAALGSQDAPAMQSAPELVPA